MDEYDRKNYRIGSKHNNFQLIRFITQNVKKRLAHIVIFTT